MQKYNIYVFQYGVPISHVIILCSPAPVQIGVTIKSLEMLSAHVQYSPDQLLIC